MTEGSAPRGIAGYAAEAERLVSQYESIAFSEIHAAILPLLPAPPAHVLDIGAGTGRDAAGFAALGYRVTAVEPTLELRRQAVPCTRPRGSTGWMTACRTSRLSPIVARPSTS